MGPARPVRYPATQPEHFRCTDKRAAHPACFREVSPSPSPSPRPARHCADLPRIPASGLGVLPRMAGTLSIGKVRAPAEV